MNTTDHPDGEVRGHITGYVHTFAVQNPPGFLDVKGLLTGLYSLDLINWSLLSGLY